MMNSQLRRIAGATWNWWTAAGLIVILVLAIGPRLTSNNTLSVPQPIGRAGLDRNADALSVGETVPAAPKAAPKLKVAVAEKSAFNTATRHANVQRRQIARTATLSLIATDVDRTVAALTALVHQVDGDVVKLDNERPADATDQHTADATIVVPADRFESTLARIAKLGGVRSQKVSAENVGDQIVDDQARLRNLRRTEADILRIMDRSGKIGEVLAVENQLSTVREQIEKLDAESQALGARVAMSTIEIHLEDEARTSVAEPNAGSQLSNAWQAAWHDSRDAALALAGRLFLLIAFAPYWLPLLAIGALIVIQVRRRVRASTISQA
jgi:hypothetical protein